MAQLPFVNGATLGVIRANTNTMFTELYAAIAALGTRGAANGVASLGSDAKVPTAQMTGKMATTDLTDVASAITAPLAAKLSNALAWDGTTPNLVSSTSPITAFGSNAFIYTGTGGKVLDGQTYATGDLALWGQGGTSTFTKVPAGGAYLGIFATAGALPTASSNAGAIALVGSAAPYTYFLSNGSAWVSLGLLGTFTTSAALQTAFPAASYVGARALVGSAAPFKAYASDGSTWAAVTPSANTLSGVTYNGSNQVTGYTLNGIAFTVAYPSGTTITVTGNGLVKTITLDGSGRVSGLATA